MTTYNIPRPTVSPAQREAALAHAHEREMRLATAGVAWDQTPIADPSAPDFCENR